MTTVTDGPAAAGRRVRASHPARPAAGAASARRPSPPSRWCFAAGASAPSGCCTGCATRGLLPRRLAAARRPEPDQLRVHPRRRGTSPTDADFTPRRRDHLVDPPRRGHPHRAGPLRQGQQRDGPAADRADRRRRRTPALGAAARRRSLAHPVRVPAACSRSADWSRADDHPAGDAGAGQLASPSARSAACRARLQSPRPGPRRAEPDLDPGRATTSARRVAEKIDGVPRGRRRRDLLNMPDDRALHRRLRDRRLARRPASSTRTSGSTATRACTWSTARRSSANLGVNPSLTITAQAERAMSLLAEPRRAGPPPAAGSAYRRLTPVAPIRPAVPASAPAALRTAGAAPSSADSKAP